MFKSVYKTKLNLFPLIILATAVTLSSCKSSSSPASNQVESPEDAEKRKLEEEARKREEEKRIEKEKQRKIAEEQKKEAEKKELERVEREHKANIQKVEELESTSRERLGVAFEVNNTHSAVEVKVALINRVLLPGNPSELDILKGLNEMVLAYKAVRHKDLNKQDASIYEMKSKLIAALALQRWKEFSLPLIKKTEDLLEASGLTLEAYVVEIDESSLGLRTKENRIFLNPASLLVDSEGSDQQIQVIKEAVDVYRQVDVLSDYQDKYVKSDSRFSLGAREEIVRGYPIETLRVKTSKLEAVLAAVQSKGAKDAQAELAQSEFSFLSQEIEKILRGLEKEGIKFSEKDGIWSLDEEFFKREVLKRAPRPLDRLQIKKLAIKFKTLARMSILPQAQKVGTLISSVTRGKEIFTFEYEESWLQSKYKFQIDPQLQLYKGNFYTKNESENFGVFLDSSPDRWGKTLMLRREALMAKQEGRAVRTLMPSDYLLGVYDETRMGGLRFKVDGNFLDNNRQFSTPPWTSIRELVQASLFVEDVKADDDPRFSAQLMLLFAPGSSLGGARPKSSVLDNAKHLWIAKFPSKKDSIDVGAWEMVVFELAKNCKLKVYEAKAQKFANEYHTFLAKRFDRLPNGRRVHFASGMTLLEHKDGDNYESGASYLEIVDFIIQNGAPSKVDRDLEELWKRIVFSIAVSNSDDHLRNHGFLLSEEGWELSPAYDINPNEMADGLSLNISLNSNALDYDLVKSVAADFRLSPDKADKIISNIKAEVKNWKTIADTYGLGRAEQQRMARAFRV